MRPANVITAHADILAGAALALGVEVLNTLPRGFAEEGLPRLLWLLLATTGLYGGGITLNDFFDARLDARERPERPIPSGRISRAGAGTWGFGWLGIGIAAAFAASPASGFIACTTACLVILYNAASKHHAFFGPLNMGLCRAGNLILGISLVPDQVENFAWVGLVPVIYIGIITFVSRSEVTGGESRDTTIAAVLMGLFTGGLAILAFFISLREPVTLLLLVPFLVLFGWRVIPPFIRAAQSPAPERIGAAVKAGVLSLIILNSVLAAAGMGFLAGLLVLLLWPVSLGLARIFAVT